MTTQTFQSGRAAATTIDLAGAARRALSAMALGLRASRDWQRLSAMGDAALAREGLERDQICRAIFDRHFR